MVISDNFVLRFNSTKIKFKASVRAHPHQTQMNLLLLYLLNYIHFYTRSTSWCVGCTSVLSNNCTASILFNILFSVWLPSPEPIHMQN